MSETKWQRSSLRKLSQELTKAEHPVSHTTVGRLLHEQHYTLKANEKRLSGTAHLERDAQFQYLENLKTAYLAAGYPVISVDSKKKELIGDFKNNERESTSSLMRFVLAGITLFALNG